MKPPLYGWVELVFGERIMNPPGVLPPELGGPLTTLSTRKPLGDRVRDRARRFVDRNRLRKLETNGARLIAKRAGQCNHGNCPSCATCTLVVVLPWVSGNEPEPRLLCDMHGEQLRSQYERDVEDPKSLMSGGLVRFAPITEAA